jgi:arginase
VTVIRVPYHLDEHTPELDMPVPDGVDVTTVAGELPDADVWTRLSTLYVPVAGAVEAEVRAGEVPTVVTGDCTTALATVAGLQRAGVEVGIVWFDAHGDVQTLETSTSGYIAGCALRFLLGYRRDLVAPLALRPVPEERVVLVDARDLDPPEVDYLDGSAIRRSTVDELDADRLPAGPLLLHIDLDVVDPADLPDLRFPAPGGPSANAVLAAARRVLDTGRVVAVDAACTWRPGVPDPTGVRARLVAGLVA